MTIRLRMAVMGTCALMQTLPLLAQDVHWDMLGVVRNVGGTVIADATITVGAQTTRTDTIGFFRIVVTRRDSLTIAVRRIGFAPVTALLSSSALTGDTLLIIMDPSAQHLEAVTVKARHLRSSLGHGAFEERRARGLGVFVTRSDIETRNTMRLSDVVRNRRGVNVVRLPSGRYGVRFVTYEGRTRGRCSPDLWIDGYRARGLEIDDVPANTVEAMELYQSQATTPFQFSAGSSLSMPCGTIVIWSRVPGGA